jgi:hypothetical protein
VRLVSSRCREEESRSHGEGAGDASICALPNQTTNILEWRGGRQGVLYEEAIKTRVVRARPLRQTGVRMAEELTSTLRQREKEDVRSVPFSRSEGT